MNDSDDSDELEVEVVSPVVTSSSSTITHATNDIPLPETNEENESYSARLITHVFNKEKALIQILQTTGPTKYLIDRKPSKSDDTLIKNLWTLL
jgi:hypothetical protein